MIRRREECAGARSKISDPKACNGLWIGPVKVEPCNGQLSNSKIGVSYDTQGTALPSLLFRLDDIFESFVRNSLREGLREAKQCGPLRPNPINVTMPPRWHKLSLYSALPRGFLHLN